MLGPEADLGSLEPGKKADIAILNDDLMTMPEDGIPGLHADTVIVDGKIVLERS